MYVYTSTVSILSDSEHVLISDSDPDPPNWWIQSLELYECDRQSLQPGVDLTGNVINAAQRVLKRQFRVDGFQNTTLADSLKFSVVSPYKLCVQVLHTGVYSLYGRCYINFVWSKLWPDHFYVVFRRGEPLLV